MWMIAPTDFGFSSPRFERLRSERTTTNEEHLEAIRHMTLQNESVAATFKVLKSFLSTVCRGCSEKSRELRTGVEPVNPSIAGSGAQAVCFYPEYHFGCARILDIVPDNFYLFCHTFLCEYRGTHNWFSCKLLAGKTRGGERGAPSSTRTTPTETDWRRKQV